MSTPALNPDGYKRSAVTEHVGGIAAGAKLMLVHGLVDENVHFRHTARLITSLIHARKPYDLLLFPDERHVPRALKDRVYMEEIVCGYLIEHVRDRKVDGNGGRL